jgi:hypothetical protein
LERNLRDLFREDAADFDTTAAVERLRARTAPRPTKRRLLWPAVGLGATTLAGGVVAALLLLASGAPVAFAGWTPVPKNLTTAQLSSVARVARNQWNPRCSGSGGSIVLADVRGPYTFTLYVTNPDRQVELATVCFNGVEHGSGGFPAGHQWPPAVAADHIHGFMTGYGALEEQPRGVRRFAFTQVGRAGARVRSVSVLLNTGKTVRATVSHGWYLVWWPAKDGHSKRLIVTTAAASGTTSNKTNTSPDTIPEPNGRPPVGGGPPSTR